MTYGTYIPKTVMITGATSGFGQAFARRFADLGCTLLLHGRNAEKLGALSGTLNTQTHTLVFDITDKAQTLEQIAAIPQDFAAIDLLINNAGGALGLDKAYEAKLEDWEAMIEMNNTSLVRITRLLLPGMVERRRGQIINIGSIAGNWVYPGGNVYNAAKAFTRHFSLALRADLPGTNIRVTNIEPGIANTDFSLSRFKGDREKAEAVYAGTQPLSAEDVAETVVWAACLPPHVNINTMEVMPTMQSFGPLTVERRG